MNPEPAAQEPTPEPSRHTGDLSGLHWEAEGCPDSCSADALVPAAVGGALGFGVSWLLGVSRGGRLLAAVVGAAAGGLASQFHMNLDWDPDRLRDADDTDPRQAL